MEFFISTVLIYFVIGFFGFLAEKENKKSRKTSAIKPPRIYFWVGLIGPVFTTGLPIVMYFFPDGRELIFWDYLAFTPFILLGICIIIQYLNWEINIDGNQFTYRTFFRRKYQFSFDEIDYIKISKSWIILKVKNKTFFPDSHAIGIERFIQKVGRKKYK
jgi:hypothetical protein